MVSADLIDTLSRIGAIGGILAIIGTGLLIFLVASQARQIRAMREWIEAEPDRQEETMHRAIAEVQRRIAAARERRANVAQQRAGAAAPVAAAGPTPAPGTLGDTPEARATAAARAASTQIATTEGGAPRFQPLAPGAGDGEDANGHGDGDVDPDATVVAEPSDETQVEEDPLGPELPAPTTAAGSRPSGVRYVDDDEPLDYEPVPEEEPHRGNRLLFGAGAIAVLVGIVLLFTTLIGGDEPATVGSSSGADVGRNEGSGGAQDPVPTPAPPSSIDVRVLNDSSVGGLAQDVTDDLTSAGFSLGTPANLSQTPGTRTATTVEYRDGERSAADQVAESLGVESSAVRPMTQQTSSAAGQEPQVVVVTGSDLQQAASTG